MEYHSDFTFEISQSLKNNQPNYIRDGNFFDNSLDQSDLRNWSVRTNHGCFKKIAAGNFLTFSLFIDELYNNIFF
jgi:hypothetical protein